MSEEKATYAVAGSMGTTNENMIRLFYCPTGPIRGQVAVVATIGTMGDWAAYIGGGTDGLPQRVFEVDIARWGNKLPENIARAFVKNAGHENFFKDRPYRE